jgi:hypothetical protein
LTETPSDTPFDQVSEASIVSFIVRVWREETSSPEQESIWRGHITCIPTGTRQYFADINEIAGLIRAYLESK